MKSHDYPPNDLIDRFEARCREADLSLTVQRRAVFEALARRTDHPTADGIYEEIRPRLPGLSRATVYRVLDTLVGIGVARRVSHPGSAARFDANTGRHHHLVCTACGRMVDYEDPALRAHLPASLSGTGFTISSYSIQFQGTCPDCNPPAKGQ